ncbi:MAG: transcription termination/antitermination NusG family protein [Candidatus Accumulibacter sp.]|uniref:transcription termination/antitermination protein NusG n=1 Tax=Accumulibacter sp. TaxID=2053492 RepID=UPI00287991A8|nr:transcription termination/antitermination NusG family protein [Accumulibacter sp.]MDS4015625.1 transcription termination/antitermination NusG family protein [Accumulibacter sp.]
MPQLSPTSSPWYVCFTKPRQEATAVRKLEEQGYEVFLPMFTRWEKTTRGWSRRQQVMFPRYAFVRCSRSEQSIAPIRSTPGVTGLVKFGNTLAEISQEMVSAIRCLEERQARSVDENGSPFEPGDMVSVSDGPLKGMSGIVSSIAADRVVVLLKLLGREKPVSMPGEHVTSV